jgi:hypothetical protein
VAAWIASVGDEEAVEVLAGDRARVPDAERVAASSWVTGSDLVAEGASGALDCVEAGGEPQRATYA